MSSMKYEKNFVGTLSNGRQWDDFVTAGRVR